MLSGDGIGAHSGMPGLNEESNKPLILAENLNMILIVLSHTRCVKNDRRSRRTILLNRIPIYQEIKPDAVYPLPQRVV
jgi:hypothetical protein